MWSGKYNFGSYQFSVTPALHEPEAELSSVPQNLFIVQSIGTKDKTHTSLKSTAFTWSICWYGKYFPKYYIYPNAKQL